MSVILKINKNIQRKRADYLKDLFELNNAGTIQFFRNADLRELIEPFDEILTKQSRLAIDITYKHSEEVLHSVIRVYEEEWTYPLVKKIILNCLLVGERENQTANKESLAKALFNYYRNVKDIRTGEFIAVIVLKLLFELKNFKLAENFILITKNERRYKKDYYIYNLYKGLIHAYSDNFKESFSSLSIAYKSKKIRHKVLFPLLIVSIFNGKTPTSSFLNKFDSRIPQELSKIIYLGDFYSIDQFLDKHRKLFLEYNLFRAAHVYMPLVCLKNLIRLLYFMFVQDNKLSIDHICDCLGVDFEEAVSMLVSLIGFNMIKGYISVNFRVIVFSKKEPFTNDIVV